MSKLAGRLSHDLRVLFEERSASVADHSRAGKRMAARALPDTGWLGGIGSSISDRRGKLCSFRLATR